MADSNRPRPRPRPKPKVQASSPLDTVPAHRVSHPNSSLYSTNKPIQIEDEDAKFLRNRGRTTKTWERLDELNKVSEAKVIHVESDSDPEGPPRARKHKRKTPAPAWSSSKALDRLLSADLGSDSDKDSDIEFLGSSRTPRATKQTQKRKRQRTRSITPPPAIPLHQLENARAIVQKTLNTAPRRLSPTLIDDSDDSDVVILNPELARIARKVISHTHSQAPASSPPPESTDIVELAVIWKPHPLDKRGKEDLWRFKMNRDDNFRDLFEETADAASVLPESLIMSYKGNRIFSSVTPMMLQIWGEAELVACDKGTYEYMRKNPTNLSQLSFGPETAPAPEETSSDEEPAASQATEATSDGDGDAFKLILRSAITKDITLTVRPTTKCGAIVKAFLKKVGVQDQYSGVFKEGAGATKKTTQRGQKVEHKDPRLCVDGDKMGNDVEIGEADLEDGDLVEVVGL